MSDRIEQIRRAHKSARPNPNANPSWFHAENEIGILLQHIERLEAQPPRLTYSQACALLVEYHVALVDRQVRGDEMQAAYMAALKACTDAMGVTPENIS
jgi:hypothetical protein